MPQKTSSPICGVSTLDRGKGRWERRSELDFVYSDEATQPSLRELERLALWARGRGPKFYLIGGWAAWRYHQGLGSRDIDVIFPNQAILDAFLKEYYQQNGYQREGKFFDGAYRKRVETAGRTVYIEIDAAQIDQGPPFKEDETLNLPYTLLEDHYARWVVGQEEVLLPAPELLILQKVKAYRDRSWELEHGLLAPVEATFLRSKVAKDAYDIQHLVPKVDNWAVVSDIAKEHGCKGLITQTLRKLGVHEHL